MKRFCLMILSALTLCLCFTIIPAPAQDAAVGKVVIDQETLKKAIVQVLKDDPKVVYDAYMSYQRQLAETRAQQQLEYSFRNPTIIPIRKDNPVVGPVSAPITIITFMDFQ